MKDSTVRSNGGMVKLRPNNIYYVDRDGNLWQLLLIEPTSHPLPDVVVDAATGNSFRLAPEGEPCPTN